MRAHLIAFPLAACLFGAAGLAVAASAPASWDGMVHVASKKLDEVYLTPGVDFRPYTKVMLDPTEVAFEKNWLRDYNDQATDPEMRISPADAKDILSKVQTGFEEDFRKAYAAAGYQVVTEPGPDVLRVRTAVANLRVNAPDRMTAGREVSFAPEAGGASVVIEARDSMSNALLGRAVDDRIAGDTLPYRRNSVTNSSDFGLLFRDWAKISVNGLNELKERSPIAGATQSAGR